MATIYFISSEYLKKHTTVNGSVDDNIIYPCVTLAQDKWMLPYLGSDLMAKLKTDVEDDTLSGNYLTLMNDYVRPAVTWWTMFEVTPHLTYRMDNGTLVQRISEDAQPISDRVMKDMLDRFKRNAEHYTTLMVEYLCANSTLFPEYSSNTWPERSPKTDVTGMSNYTVSGGNTSMSFTGYFKRLSQLP